MKLRLLALWDDLTSSFWFVPTLMALFASLGAGLTLSADHVYEARWIREWPVFWTGSATGAANVLAVVAGSTMTVVSIVFSITITALAQLSGQRGPLLVRTFTRDRGVQATLGIFVAAFLYCLLVLRTVRPAGEGEFVPVLSVNIGLALALLSMGQLIYFVHHVTQTLQVDSLLAHVAGEFRSIVPQMFPDPGEEPEDRRPERDPDVDWERLPALLASHDGYVQRMEEGRIVQIAAREDLLIRIEVRPGDFVIEGAPLMRVRSPRELSVRTRGRLQSWVLIGVNRTPAEDPDYPLQQLAEIGARALSPGINEPFTAMAAIDWIGACLGRVAARRAAARHRHDAQGRLRLIVHPPDFAQLVSSFDVLRLYGVSNPDVACKLVTTLGDLGDDVQRPPDRAALRRQVEMVRESLPEYDFSGDRDRVRQTVDAALAKLNAPGDGA